MSDIDLYSKSPETYDDLQNKRPDYAGAQQAFIELAFKYFKDKKDVSVSDFCCGTGGEMLQFAQKIQVNRATLIDINGEFLKIAKEKGISAKETKTIESDILNADVTFDNDAVISMFAYHHVKDEDKKKYVDKIKDSLKIGGLLFLGEIYSPDMKTTFDYYEHLIGTTPAALNDPSLQIFLRQTAKSENFEYKVSRTFAYKQLIKECFELIDSKKIWPLDSTFDHDVGTFVEVWRMNVSSTKKTILLADALKKKGIELELEHYDQHKHVDIYIPKARLYIEVEGLQHYTSAKQILADFKRDHYSNKEGFATFHVTNQLIEKKLPEIVEAIVEIVEDRQKI